MPGRGVEWESHGGVPGGCESHTILAECFGKFWRTMASLGFGDFLGYSRRCSRGCVWRIVQDTHVDVFSELDRESMSWSE
jgi:hypothetical protein